MSRRELGPEWVLSDFLANAEAWDQDDIGELAAFVGHFQGEDDAAISHDAGFRPLGVFQGVNVHRLSVGSLAKRFFDNRVGGASGLAAANQESGACARAKDY